MLLVESGDLNIYKKMLNKKRSLIPLVSTYIFVQGLYSFLCFPCSRERLSCCGWSGSEG